MTRAQEPTPAPPPHPGWILRDRVLPGLGLSVSQAARELRIARQTLHRVLAGRAAVSPEMATRLARLSGTAPRFWLERQHQQSLLYSSDLELGETTRAVFAAIDRTKPVRIVIDSLSEIRLLAQSSLRYRRQILAMKHYFARQGSTVLLLDDLTTDTNDKTVHSLAHGVIRLEGLTPNYGAERRRLRVIKYRGQSFRGGFHGHVIAGGGGPGFPRPGSG